MAQQHTTTTTYHTQRFPRYDRARLARHMRERGFLGRPEQLRVEEDRCASDPIYALQHRPEEVIELRDHEHPERGVLGTTTLIDRFLESGLDILYKKCGPHLRKSAMFQAAETFLRSPQATPRIKLFFVFCVLSKVPDACEVVRLMYDPETHARGEECYDQFDALMLHVDRWVGQLLGGAYNECTIAQTVNQFVLATKRTYMME